MAITTYAELQTAVDNWLHRSNTAARVQEMIVLAEADIRRSVRARDMETTADLTISSQRTSLPTGFVGYRRLYIDGDPVQQLTFMPPENFWRKWVSSQTGKPTSFTIEEEDVVVGPAPDATYTGKQLYFRLQALTGSVVPSLFTNHPDLYLFGTLIQSQHFYGPDSRIAGWSQQYAAIMQSIRHSNIRDRMGTGPYEAHTDVGNP